MTVLASVPMRTPRALAASVLAAAVLGPALAMGACKKVDDPLPPPLVTEPVATTVGAVGAGATAPAVYVAPPSASGTGGSRGTGLPATSITVLQGPPGTPTTFVIPQGSITVVPGVSGAPPTIQLPPGLTIPTSIVIPGLPPPPPPKPTSTAKK